jgi:hypothetical protein
MSSIGIWPMLKVISAVAVVLFVLLLNSAYAATCEGQKGRVIFEDDFTADSTGWAYHLGSSWDAGFGKSGLNLHIQDPTKSWTFWNIIHKATEGDFCVEAVMPKAVGADLAARIGLLFLANNTITDFYLLLIGSETPTPSNQQRGSISLWRKDGGNRGKLGDWSDLKIKLEPGSVIALRAVVKPNLISVLVNGTEVKTLRAQLSEGNLKNFGIYV